MKPKIVAKIIVDLGMIIMLLLLMTYELIGQEAHEWIGVGMFVLFIFHHILNNKWSRNSLKGKYTAIRIMQTVLVIGVFFTMIGSLISGIILSRHVFTFLPIEGGRSFARTLHMVSAYWGLVLMSLHLGFHWSIMMGMAKRIVKKSFKTSKWTLRMIALLIAWYGGYAFWQRGIGSYLFLNIQFVFFDFDEPLLYFVVDYMAVMGLFVFLGHYFSVAIKNKILQEINSNVL